MTDKPTEILGAEHKVILKVVKAAGMVAEGLESGRDIQPDVIRDIAGFMRDYGDGFHHGKEEKELFPLLARKGVPVQGCPIAALVREHETGRNIVSELYANVDAFGEKDADATAKIAGKLKGLSELYLNHIWKEEFLLFPMTNVVLADADQEELLEKFKKADGAMDRDLIARYEDLAMKFELFMQPA